MNLYELASQDEAWGAFTLDDNDDGTPLSAWPADPPASMPPGPVPLDAALEAAAREYGVDADVLRALGHGGSVDSIFDTAASLRSRLEAFDGDYAQALASYRREEEGNAGDALAAPAAAPLSPPTQADAQVPAPGPAPTPAPSERPRPARPQAAAPVPGAPPSQAARPDQPPAPPDARLGAADDPRSLLYRQAPATQKPFVDEVKSQLASGAKTLARMLPGIGAAARWVATQPEATAGKATPASVGSVLERAAPPADLPSASFAPVRPEVRQAFGNAWNAANPEDRQRMQSMPGWQGQLARERAAQFARADEGALSRSPTATLLDTRAEGRTKALIAKGEHPDFARRAASEGAAAGVAPGQEIKALGGTVQPSTYDFDTKNLFDPDHPANLLNNAVVRGVAKGGLGLGKGVVGLSQAIEDLTGADDATRQRTADRATSLRGMEQAIGERGTHLQRNFEGAVSSITQQLPMLVTGSFVPSQLLSMGGIAVQSFGQEYSDGKSRGLDPQQAAGRAGAFAAFEVIGEKFGFKGNMEAIRKATAGMHGDALAGFLANLVKKEIPGEVLTTTGQFAVDKWAPAGMALNPNATLGDYVQQLGDTITQTVMQGAMMSGGRRVLGGGVTQPAPRVQDQSTAPHAPQAGEGTYEGGTGNTTAPTPAPSSGSTAPATGYHGEPVPNTTQWSDVAAADKKARAEAEILRQAEALPAQDAATGAATTPSPAAPSATPTMPMPASTDGNSSGTQQGANALPHGQVNSDADQAETATQASAADPATNAPGTPAPAPTPSAANAEADASAAATDIAPATTQHGSAHHTATAQVQPPASAPIDAQVQALDSGMLVIGGDQATILAHLQAGGVRGAEPFAGVTVVPVDQAALAQRVLSRPLAVTAGPQVGSGSQRASATATLPQARAASRFAPADPRGGAPTAGSSKEGSSDVGAGASRTEHGSPANRGAFQPAPVMQMQRDGTLMVKGDPAQLQERLRQGGVDRVLRRKGGVVVGLDQVDKARQLLGGLQPAQPHNPAPSQGKLVAESYRSGYSSVNGRVQEPTQPDDGLGPTQGDARAAGDGALRRGGGAPLPHRTASLVGVGFAGRMEPADDQGSSQGILRRDGRTSLPRRTAALVGLGIAERIERSGSQSLLGEQVDSPQRLAELAQVYRDPRFETFRVFFVKDGVVVHATGVSSRMPGTAPMAPAGVSEQEYVNQMRDIKQKTGADSYYLLHNHPSGNPTPSPEDVGLTRMLGAHVPGLVAHVVINSNKYAVIDAANQGREPADMVRYQDFGEDRLLKASKPMAVLGEKMAGPDDLAIVGKSMQRPGWITLIGTGADGKVRAISEAPASILTRNYPYLAATVRRFMRQSGSGSVFAVGDAGDIGSKPVRDALAAGILHDALPDAGRTLHQQGVHTGGKGFSLTRGRRVAEGEPGSSAPSAVSMHTQRDGTLMVKGDPVQLQEHLRQGGVERVLRREGGVVVGLDQVGKARQLLQQPPPRTSASADHSLPSPLSGQQFSRNASASKAEDGPSPASRYSTRSTLPKAELSLERIDQVIQETLAGVAGAPPVKAVGSPGDIELVVPAEVMASGITLGSGDIYVFQSGVGSDLDVRLVVFHELLHRGVRFLVPRAQYVQTMLDLAASDTRVQQYANEWKRTGIVPQQREQLARLGYTGSELQGQLEAMAIEEGLARISEELNVDLSMGTRWKPSRIRALAQWLATVADKAGMAKLARAIRAMTYNEAERFVMRAIEHAGRKDGDAQGNSQARFNTTSAHQSQGSGAAGAGTLQFSRTAATKTAYEARIDALFAGAPANRIGVTVLDSSDMLGLLGYAATPLYLQESKVLQGQFKHPHMTAAEWMKVPQWLESPAAVFDSDTVAGRLVVVAPETVQGSHVLMVVEPDAEIGSAALRLHLLVNAYDKDDGPPPYGRWLRDGLARYVDQKKFPTILAQAGLRLPSTAVQNKPGTRRILSEKHLAGYRRAQGEGPGARPGAHTSQGLPSQPATVQSVKAAVAKLTNSMGLLAEGRGRVVVATSADIQAHWEPLVGEVDLGSPVSGLAQGFYDPNSKTVFLIADHIEAGQEMAVAAHELVHKHGKAVLGEQGWKQLHEVIGSWANRPKGSLERRVYDEAMARVQASRPDSAEPGTYSSEELFPYAVQVAMELGVQPTALMPANSVQGWLARVRASLQALLGKLTGNPQAFDGQDLVDLAFGIAQRERSTRDDTSGAATDLVHGTAQRTALLFSRTRVPKVREASTFSEAREAVKQFQGKELTNESTGLKAVVSRNSLDKMLSGKAVAKSETLATHAMAVANADSLFEHAILGWSKQDRSDDVNIRAVHRFFAHMQVNGRSKLVKLTVKETGQEGRANPLYTVEAVELNEHVPSAQWLEAAAREDGLELNTKDPQRGEWVGEIADPRKTDPRTTLYGVQLPARAVNHSAGDLFSLAQEIERRNARGDAAGDATPRFSTRSNDQGPGLSLEQVQQLVQQALSGLRNPPPVDVVLRAADLGIVAPEGAMGVWTGNRLAIVVENHRQVIQVRETVFHELFHAGLRNILPRRDYVQAMLDLAKRDARVHQYAMDWKKDAPEAAMQLQALRDAGFAGSELTAQYEALAIEEGLAVVAEELRGRMQAGLRLGEQVRVFAGWLASVADRMGMNRLADAIRAMTYSEAERFVIRAIDHAGAAGGEMENSGRARFSTRRAQAPQAGAATFFAQPTDSVQMQIQRDGTLMVRGDPTQLQERLRQGGVDRVLRRKGGVVVGLDQVHKARQLLRQPPSAPAWAGPSLPSRPSLSGQQFSRSAPPSPDRTSRSRGLPAKPATVQSVRAAVAKLTNSMGLLAEGRGRMVVATSADIQAHWEPLIGEVDMGSQDTSLAQGFYDPNTNTIFLIADHIEAGQEMAVAAHELVHKHGKAVLGEARWRQLHEVIGSWANRPEGSLERRVHDEAAARVQGSRPTGADEASYSSEELFPYAVQVAMELGVEPTALMPANSVQGWLARVRASLQTALNKLTNNPQAFDGQDLVDLAFGIAQQERAGAAPVQWQGEVARSAGGSASPSSPSSSSPPRPLQMSRDAGKDGAGAAKEKGPLGSENNPRPVPLTDFKVRIIADDHPSNAITMLVDGEHVVFSGIEINDGYPILFIGKNGKKKSGEHIVIDAHGVTEAMLKAVISYYIETKGAPPVGFPGNLTDDNRKNFRKEFDKHRARDHNGTIDDWAQSAIRDISFGKAR